MQSSLFEKAVALRADNRPVVRIVELHSGADWLLTPDGVEGPTALPPEVAEAAREAQRHDRSHDAKHGDQRYFLHVYNPPRRLVVVGAVHITQPLIQIAEAAGYAVTVIDPRGAFATAERFPGVTLNEDWPDEAMEALRPDNRTAVVTLTHDPKLDDPALEVALRSDAFYVGSLGSRKTHASRVERLTAAGLTAAEIGKIHAPIGLHLGGRAPAEIAIAIMAQITQVLHLGAGQETKAKAAA
ncbi:MAG: XdhC family protein [Alphaproteobacteria bacterium]|nr:XdhC family protein [Alphaproteobacteria bacterium]MCB9930719.1 XdhC family protein [Alphaproteobacteria bacterium]